MAAAPPADGPGEQPQQPQQQSPQRHGTQPLRSPSPNKLKTKQLQRRRSEDCEATATATPVGAWLQLQPGQSFLEIDGSVLEGGGQIIRNSFALSALLRKPIRISRVRANRPKPGLHAQHLAGVQLVASLHGGAVEGAFLHSPSLAFAPAPCCIGQQRNTTAAVDIGTAGSIGLIVQIAMPTLVFGAAPGTRLQLDIRGGTHVTMSPTTDYLSQIFIPAATEHLGLSATLTTSKNGFYPKGGGEARLSVHAVEELRPVKLLDRGEVEVITIRTHISRIPRHVADREAQSALQTIKAKLRPLPKRVDVEPLDVANASFGEGTWCQITARTTTGCVFCATAIGERSKRAEEVGAEAAQHLLKDLSEGGCVDEFMQDQLIVFMALARGESAVRVGQISMHTQTSIYIAKMLTGATFTVVPDPPPSTTSVIRCVGIGFKNPFSATPTQSAPMITAQEPPATSATPPLPQ